MSETDKSTSMKTGRTQVKTNKSSEFVRPFGRLVRRFFEDYFVVETDKSSKTDLNLHWTNKRSYFERHLKGSETNKGSVILWVIKMAAVAS